MDAASCLNIPKINNKSPLINISIYYAAFLASENKTPKLLEELQKISADLADCKSDLKEKNQRIHELANSVMTKEAMIERLQNDLKAFKKEAAQEMEKRL